MTAQGWRLAGALIGLALPLFLLRELPALPALASLLVLAAFLAFWHSLRWHSFILLGFVFGCLQLTNLIARQLPQAFEGEDVKLTLVIASLPEKSELSTRFEAEILEAEFVDSETDFQWRERVRLSWYQAPELHVGERWQLLVRLKRPRGFVNPGVFDYQAWLLSHKIFATGYVRKTQDNQRLAESQLHSSLVFEKFREHIDYKLFKQDLADQPGKRYTRFMRALLTGDKTYISQQDWQVLQATGTLHLMAISGLHVGLIATLGFIFGKLFVRLALSMSGSRRWLFLIAPLGSVLFAFTYAGLAGFSVPTQRALLFVLLVNAALIIGRRINYFHALLVCACLIGLYDPFVFLSPGFYLSFGAVLVLFWCFMGRTSVDTQRSTKVVGFFKAQLVLFAGLFLPLSLLTLPISVVGLLANSIAIPVVGFIVVPLLFLSSFVVFVSEALAGLVLVVVDITLKGLWNILLYLNQLEFSYIRFALFDPVLSVALGLLAFSLLAPRALSLRLLCLPLLLLVLFLPKPENDFELTVLDVGQGLAVYVTWPDGNLLYDTGARFSSDFDIGSRVIVPWLQNKSVSALDFLVISHGDNDHAGGLQGVLAGMAVSNVWAGPSVKKEQFKIQTPPIQSSDPETSECNSDIYLEGSEQQGMTITVLWPLPEAKPVERDNNSSCVLLLNYQGTNILFAGDIEKDVEFSLLAAGTLPERIDLLIAPHHGSRSSSTRAFIEQLKPRAVVFSAGYRNRYHHPNTAVVQRYVDAGAEIYRTDLEGAITFVRAATGELVGQRARVDTARVWFW